jgi:hypothetical protein
MGISDSGQRMRVGMRRNAPAGAAHATPHAQRLYHVTRDGALSTPFRSHATCRAPRGDAVLVRSLGMLHSRAPLSCMQQIAVHARARTATVLRVAANRCYHALHAARCTFVCRVLHDVLHARCKAALSVAGGSACGADREWRGADAQAVRPIACVLCAGVVGWGSHGYFGSLRRALRRAVRCRCGVRSSTTGMLACVCLL